MALELVVLAVLLPFVSGTIAFWLSARLRENTGWWALCTALISFASIALFLPAVSQGERFFVAVPWVPGLGINASFVVDGLSLFFALIVAGIGTLIFFYSRHYFQHGENVGKFYSLMLLFMGSMLGTVLSSNLLFLFLFWEFTSLTSFFLIGFWPDREESRRSALQAMFVTVLGGLAMLAGFVLLYVVAGTFELVELLDRREQIVQSPLYFPILVLVLLGAFTKSAQFPFHFWLPNAMVAPTPVSAYLHSAAMVKAGIFLIARFFPILSGTDAWLYLVAGTGLITTLWGGYMAVRQMELKALLAYSTISQLGLIVACYGFGTEAGVVAATFLVINHAIFKSALFMIVGIVNHVSGAREIHLLGGLASKIPATTGVAALAVFSLAGIPPMGGFLSKELFFEASIDLAGSYSQLWSLPLIVVLGAVLTVIYALKFLMGTFFGPGPGVNGHVHPVPRWFLFTPAVLAALSLLVGLVPGVVESLLVGPASTSILGYPLHHDVKLWNGWSLPLLMSAAGLALGLVGYRQLRYARLMRQVSASRFGAEKAYDACFRFLTEGTAQIYLRVQSGYLRRYVMVVACAPVVLAGLALFTRGGSGPIRLDFAGLEVYDYAIAVFFIVATLATAWQSDRLGAILALGAVGSLVSLTYLVYSAPDLALTQLLIEIMSVVLFALVFVYMLPFCKTQVKKAFLARDAAIGGVVGILVTGLMLFVTSSPLYASIRDYYLETAVSLAGGHNVVNVIIVDYRGYDTMGEISVLAISAVALFSLIKFGKRRRSTERADTENSF